MGILICAPILGNAATKEQAVKAGFVYNITKYVIWPNDAGSNEKFNLCVLGDAQLGGGLKSLSGKLVANKSLKLRRWVKDEHLNTCHMVFVSQGRIDSGVGSVLLKLSQLPILTVSDSPDFINHGGMVGLIRDGTRVSFEVNLQAVNAAGLNMSAQLLKLAKTVKGLK